MLFNTVPMHILTKSEAAETSYNFFFTLAWGLNPIFSLPPSPCCCTVRSNRRRTVIKQFLKLLCTLQASKSNRSSPSLLFFLTFCGLQLPLWCLYLSPDIKCLFLSLLSLYQHHDVLTSWSKIGCQERCNASSQGGVYLWISLWNWRRLDSPCFTAHWASRVEIFGSRADQ